jgi:hypothetical protein
VNHGAQAVSSKLQFNKIKKPDVVGGMDPQVLAQNSCAVSVPDPNSGTPITVEAWDMDLEQQFQDAHEDSGGAGYGGGIISWLVCVRD